MRSAITILLAGFVTALSTLPAHAQEHGDVGITMGYPTAVGFLFHVTDGLAIRPEVSFTTATTDVTLTTSSSTVYGVGVSGLVYVKRWDALSTYVSPRYAYQHGSSTSTLDVNLPISLPISLPVTLPQIETTSTINQHTISGAFGAQFRLHEHFSAFGEVGAAYSILKTSTSLAAIPLPSGLSTPTSHSFGLRSSAGVIFYF